MHSVCKQPGLLFSQPEGLCAALTLTCSSVAAFSRLALELMAAGADPGLLAAALRAAQDELRHARVAYGLAAHLDGHALGAAPLDLCGTAPRSDLAEVALECLDDGCVGELAGALALRRAASLAGDPWLAGVLARMADEEESHALLAFGVLRLALAREGGDGALRASVSRAIEAWEAEADGAVDPSAPTDRVRLLASYGVLPRADVAALRVGALGDVVLPALRGLLSDRVGAGRPARLGANGDPVMRENPCVASQHGA